MKTTPQTSGLPRAGRRDLTFIWQSRLGLLMLGALLLGGTASQASDPLGVLALVDRVTLEPSADAPERIKIWGTFVIADGSRGSKYREPQKGYLYFKLPSAKPEVARKEWNDLLAAAGKGEVIGFGTRFGEPAQVRSGDEKASNPDEYRTGFGLVRLKNPASYAPARSLLEFRSKEVRTRT